MTVEEASGHFQNIPAIKSKLDTLLGAPQAQLAVLFIDLDEPPLDAATDRGMICGSPAMLADISAMLDNYGFEVSPHIGQMGDYVIERAFVEK